MSDRPAVVVSNVHQDDSVIYVDKPVRPGWLLIDGQRVLMRHELIGDGPYGLYFRPATIGRAILAGTPVTEA